MTMKFAYVGCRTTKERNARGRGLKVYRVDGLGRWEETQLVKGLENPSYLAFDREEKFLYCVHGDKDYVSSFKIDEESGGLTQIGCAAAGGKNPVFISVDKGNRRCFVATLQGGKVSTLERLPDGSLSEPVHEAAIPGIEAGFVSYPHQCLQDVEGNFLIVPIQGRKTGTGALNLYRIEKDGSLSLSDRREARQHDEPRHFAFHPSNRCGCLINEKGNCVTCFDFDAAAGKITPKQILSSLPEYYTGEGQASAMLIHPGGRFAYASNRIHDSIASYSIDPHTGYLRLLGFTDALGKTPRFMTFDEKGEKLYVANEDSDTIVEFAIEADSGRPVFTGRTVAAESPVCVIFTKER